MNPTPGVDMQSHAHNSSRPVLLCVDDRREVLEIRKAKFESIGYSVTTATNTAAALAILERLPVAAVLVEYKNEGMDAEAVAYQIKQKFPRQPVILLSAYAGMPERTLWLVDEYVMRSAPATTIAETIARVTRGSARPESRVPNAPKTQDAAA